MRREDFDYARLRVLTEQLKRMVPYYYGDFYPLTPYSLDQEDWIAWQFHLPNGEEGMVQAFRRSKSEAATSTFRLGGLDPDAKYRVHDLDQDAPVTISGRELIEKGITVSTANQPGAVMIHYSRTE